MHTSNRICKERCYTKKAQFWSLLQTIKTPTQALTPPARHEIIIESSDSRQLLIFIATFTRHKILSKHRTLQGDAGDITQMLPS